VARAPAKLKRLHLLAPHRWGENSYRDETIKKRRDKISLTLCKTVYTFINISIVKKKIKTITEYSYK